MNKKYFSKIGISLVVLYLLIVGGILAYMFSCDKAWCGIVPGLAFIFTLMPIISIFDSIFGYGFFGDGTIGMIIIQILNVLALYGIGLVISFILTKLTSKSL